MGRYIASELARNLYQDTGRKGSPWVVRHKVEGVTKEHVVGLVSEEEAVTLRNSILGHNDEEPLGDNPLCKDAWPQWMAMRKNPRSVKPLAEGTQVRYQELWDLHAVHVLGPKRVLAVTPRDIGAVFTRMETLGYQRKVAGGKLGERREYSDSAINNMRVALSSFFQGMTEEPFRARKDNPVHRLGGLARKTPTSDAVPVEAVMLPAEVKDVAWGFGSDYRKRMGTQLVHATGLRLSEMLALSWADIDFDLGEVGVSRQLTKTFKAGDPTTWFKAAKGEKTKVGNRARVVPLTDDVMALLKEYRTWLFSQGLYHATGLVFPTNNNTPISQRNFTRAFDQAVEKAGLDRYAFTFHCLRHTFASDLFALGFSIEEVASYLGHTSDVTLKRYVHITNRQAINDSFRQRFARAGGE